MYRKIKPTFFWKKNIVELPCVSIAEELSENRSFAPASSGAAMVGSARLVRRRAARSNSESVKSRPGVKRLEWAAVLN